MIGDKTIMADDICIANIILLFALSFEYFPENFECHQYLSHLFQIFQPYRKYFSYLLRIIYKLYKRALEENNNKMKERMKVCFYKCFNHINQKRIIPNENLIMIINKIQKLLYENNNNNFNNEENVTSGEDNNNNEILDFTITKKNLHVYHNFIKDQFFKENYIVNLVNEKQKGAFQVAKENLNVFTPKIRYIENKRDFIDCVFVCQKDLYEKLKKEYNKYIENLDSTKVKKYIILEACLNIFIFLINNVIFNEHDDIKKIMEIIFYIFKNKN